MTPSPSEPFFGTIPKPVLGLCAVITLISAVQILAPDNVAVWVTGAGAVQFGRPQLPQPLGAFAPLFLHVFLHGGWFHLGMNMLGLLAFGSPVARWLDQGKRRGRGMVSFFVLFFAAALGGALAESGVLLVSGAQSAVLLGASGGLMGLIGVLVRLDYGRRIDLAPILSRPVLIGLVPWVGLNLVLAVFGAPGMGGNIAWAAHIGGLLTGLVLAGFISPKN